MPQCVVNMLGLTVGTSNSIHILRNEMSRAGEYRLSKIVSNFQKVKTVINLLLLHTDLICLSKQSVFGRLFQMKMERDSLLLLAVCQDTCHVQTVKSDSVCLSLRDFKSTSDVD